MAICDDSSQRDRHEHDSGRTGDEVWHIEFFILWEIAYPCDGSKRIAAALFITFLAGSRVIYRKDGTKRIADNALVAITLMIAESDPADKETMVKLIVNLINTRN
jgi:hypothetical protein